MKYFTEEALKNHRIRLITIDLDGTALQEDHQHFSDRLHKALDEAVKAGIAVVPVTGRQISGLPQALLEQHAWYTIAVTANGAMIHDLRDQSVLSAHPFDKTLLQSFIRECTGQHLIIELGSGHHDYLTQQDMSREKKAPALSFHVNYILSRLGLIVDHLDLNEINEPVIKVNLIAANEKEHAEASALCSRYPFHATETSPDFFEISEAGVSKASGLLEVCRMLKIDPADTMSFGDSENDRSILEASGCSIAMGNAPETIKSVCDYVTDTNVNDGVAKVVEAVIRHQNDAWKLQ